LRAPLPAAMPPSGTSYRVTVVSISSASDDGQPSEAVIDRDGQLWLPSVREGPVRVVFGGSPGEAT
jgi:hypothetical protein